MSKHRVTIEKVDGGFLIEDQDENFNMKRKVAKTSNEAFDLARDILGAPKEKDEPMLPSVSLTGE